MTLSTAFNVRLKHPEVNQIIPLNASSGNKQTLGVFVLDKRAKKRGEFETPTQQLLKYQLDLAEQELVAIENQAVKFVSNAIYKIMPLQFGGFLAFDPEFVYFYGEGQDCLDARKLR